jgi:hypothetical protein
MFFLENPRRTVDIDFVVDFPTKEFNKTLEAVGNELQVEVDIIPIDEFILLPLDASKRHQNLEKFGS